MVEESISNGHNIRFRIKPYRSLSLPVLNRPGTKKGPASAGPCIS